MRSKSTTLTLAMMVFISACARAEQSPKNIPQEVSKKDKPHIILMMTDDQGYGDVSYYGHDELKTPELDKMSKAGIRFDRYYAADSVCSPSRAGFLTGRNPNRYGTFDWGYDMPLREVTLAEMLQPNGYTTSHFGKWHLGGFKELMGGTNRGGMQEENGKTPDDRHPANQGFDYYYSQGNHYNIGEQNMVENGVTKPMPKDVDTSDDLIDKALVHFDKVLEKGEDKIFSVIWFPSPHKPHSGTDTYKKPYDQYGASAYYAELAGVDNAVGRLRQYLKDKGIAHNTMLWFSSDNGPYKPGRTNGLKGQKYTYFEGGIRVPGLMEWPAVVTEPFVCDVPCSTFDYFPTILKMLDIKIPEKQYDGIDIMPIIKKEVTKRNSPIYFQARSRDGDIGTMVAVHDDYKLYRGMKSQARKNKGGKASYFYNLKTDPSEENNLYKEDSAIKDQMMIEMGEWQKSVEKDLALYPKTVPLYDKDRVKKIKEKANKKKKSKEQAKEESKE